MVDNFSIAANAFPMLILTQLTVEEILLSRNVNCSSNFDLTLKMEMAPSCFYRQKLIHFNKVSSNDNIYYCLEEI